MRYLIFNTKISAFDANIKFVHYLKMKKKISPNSTIIIVFNSEFDLNNINFIKYIDKLVKEYSNQVKVVWLYDIDILKYQLNECQ